MPPGLKISLYRAMNCSEVKRFHGLSGCGSEKVSQMKVGNGLEDGNLQGPLIDMRAVEKVEELVGDAAAQGGKIVTGGKRHALGGSFGVRAWVDHEDAEVWLAEADAATARGNSPAGTTLGNNAWVAGISNERLAPSRKARAKISSRVTLSVALPTASARAISP